MVKPLSHLKMRYRLPLVIRLHPPNKRNRRKNFKTYRIVVGLKTKALHTRGIEYLGKYTSVLDKQGARDLQLIPERIRYWMAMGAQPSITVHRLLYYAGMLPSPLRSVPFELPWVARMKKRPSTLEALKNRVNRGMSSGAAGMLRAPPTVTAGPLPAVGSLPGDIELSEKLGLDVKDLSRPLDESVLADMFSNLSCEDKESVNKSG
eukprot:885789_1